MPLLHYYATLHTPDTMPQIELSADDAIFSADASQLMPASRRLHYASHYRF
jgi:hypothetical protein